MKQAIISAFLGRLRDRFCEYQAPLTIAEKLATMAKIPGVAIMPPVPRVAGRRCTTHLISACRPFDPRRRRTAGRASAVRTQPLATATCQ